jgi:peptidoglycan/LPS O-acetylase OafA/YrhL
MPELATLGAEELLIILFLLGVLLLMALLVVVAAAMLFVWAPGWLEQQHGQWHAAHMNMPKGRE